MKQTAGQSREQFFESVARGFLDSDMAKISVDQLQVHVIVAGLSDPLTKEKVFEKKNLTTSSLLELLQDGDANSRKLEGHKSPCICTVSPGGRGRPGGPSGAYGGRPGGRPGGYPCLLYTSPSPRDGLLSRMPSSA